MICITRISFKHIVLFLAILTSAAPVIAQETITITTWNIETLGGQGRGFASGYGKGHLELRTQDELEDIAKLIKNKLKSDVLAIQEVAISWIDDGLSYSDPLETITSKLGNSWAYYLPDIDMIPEGHGNLFCAYVWNKERVRLLDVFPMNLPNHSMGRHPLYSRQPIIAYFEVLKNGEARNDFVLVNIHLKSGQGNEENHIIAIVEAEHNLTTTLKQNRIKESDRIILGDFNDNPYAKTNAGNQKYSDALYHHMSFKRYIDLVTDDFHSTRMDQNLTSIIDHILVNKSAKRHVSTNKATIYLPGQPSAFAEWRKTYSDHFPLSFKLTIESSDDDVDY